MHDYDCAINPSPSVAGELDCLGYLSILDAIAEIREAVSLAHDIDVLVLPETNTIQ